MKAIKRLSLVILSAILLALSFPNFNIWPAAYIAFIPLFLALKTSSKKTALVSSYLCGLVFFGITIFWMHHVSIIGYILLILILSLFFGIFGIFFLYAIRYTLYAIFSIPAFWVVLEYMRSNLFSGFGWTLLGHSQYLNIPIIQISDITGAYGVSFLVMMVNVALFHLLIIGARRARSTIFICILLVALLLGYGIIRLNEETSPKRLNISLIQGNIPQEMKWDSQYKDYILDVYIGLTKDAAREGAELIIWPETALPGFVEEEGILAGLGSVAKDAGAYLLVGAPSYDEASDAVFNSTFLISKEGTILKRHDKLHLVPFGEYIPYERYIKFLREYIDKPIGDYTAGRNYTIFKMDDGLSFSVLICFEDIFPSLVRNFTLRGADFIVNITNDAWFMKTAAPYQHAQSSVFRAVENRLPVVRAANTGLSCFIDRYGRIIDTVRVDGEEIFVRGFKTKGITIREGRSFYGRFGDIFIFVCAIVLILKGVLRWSKRSLY